jgi:alkylation response protein AidB-like acyl-CoA dehydrogenase
VPCVLAGDSAARFVVPAAGAGGRELRLAAASAPGVIEVAIEAGRSAVYYAAASLDAGDPASRLHAAAIKAQVRADGARAADSALAIHGAIGYTWEYDLQLFFKRARLDRQLFGAPAAWNERIADGLALV